MLCVQIVYVAPMKALAAEVTSNFGKRLAPLGLVVKELTGGGGLKKGAACRNMCVLLDTGPEGWQHASVIACLYQELPCTVRLEGMCR